LAEQKTEMLISMIKQGYTISFPSRGEGGICLTR